MRKLELFKLVRIRFGEKVSKVRKNWKNQNFNSRFGWKNGKINFFFQKNRACARGGKYFLVTTNWCAEESSSRWLESQLKHKSLKHRKKWKTNVWRIGLGQINKKIFFWKHARFTGDNFFSDYYRKMRQGNLIKSVPITLEV